MTITWKNVTAPNNASVIGQVGDAGRGVASSLRDLSRQAANVGKEAVAREDAAIQENVDTLMNQFNSLNSSEKADAYNSGDFSADALAQQGFNAGAIKQIQGDVLKTAQKANETSNRNTIASRLRSLTLDELKEVQKGGIENTGILDDLNINPENMQAYNTMLSNVAGTAALEDHNTRNNAFENEISGIDYSGLGSAEIAQVVASTAAKYDIQPNDANSMLNYAKNRAEAVNTLDDGLLTQVTNYGKDTDVILSNKAKELELGIDSAALALNYDRGLASLTNPNLSSEHTKQFNDFIKQHKITDTEGVFTALNTIGKDFEAAGIPFTPGLKLEILQATGLEADATINEIDEANAKEAGLALIKRIKRNRQSKDAFDIVESNAREAYSKFSNRMRDSATAYTNKARTHQAEALRRGERISPMVSENPYTGNAKAIQDEYQQKLDGIITRRTPKKSANNPIIDGILKALNSVSTR